MTFSIELTDEPPKDWNDFLKKEITGNVYNTIEHSKYSVLEGLTPKFFRMTDSDGNITLQTLVFEQKYQSKKIPKIVQKMIKGKDLLLRWNYGPITSSEDSLRYFFEYMKKTKKRIHGITHPFLKVNDITLFSKKKWGTFLIDLTKPEEEIYNNIEKHSGRKNIERSIERNVKVEPITDNSILEYLQLFNQTKRETNREETSEEQMVEFWNIMKPVGLTGYLARKDNVCIGGMLFSCYNGYINEWGVARSTEDYTEKLYSQDLIKWKIIEWGIQNKMNWYDLSGFNPNPESKKEQGIYRYKKKWNGKEFTQWIITN